MTILADNTVPADSSYSVECNATRDLDLESDTTLEIEWLDSNGLLIRGGDEITISGDTSTNGLTLTSTLTFNSITTTQAGPYYCSVNLTIPGAGVFDHNVRRSSVVRVMSKLQ